MEGGGGGRKKGDLEIRRWEEKEMKLCVERRPGEKEVVER